MGVKGRRVLDECVSGDGPTSCLGMRCQFAFVVTVLVASLSQIRCTDHSGDLVISVNGRSVDSTRTQLTLFKLLFAPLDTLFDLTQLAETARFSRLLACPAALFSSFQCLFHDSKTHSTSSPTATRESVTLRRPKTPRRSLRLLPSPQLSCLLSSGFLFTVSFLTPDSQQSWPSDSSPSRCVLTACIAHINSQPAFSSSASKKQPECRPTKTSRCKSPTPPTSP